MVRVRVDDATWDRFKYMCRNDYMSNVLGDLVRAAVAKEFANSPQISPEQIDTALAEARKTAQGLLDLIDRLEVLA